MANLVSIASKIQNAEIESGSIESEVLNQRIGANINGLIDTTDTNESRITDIENKSESKDNFISNNTIASLSTVVVADNLITPTTTNVLILPIGGFWFDNFNLTDPEANGGTVVLKLLRGGVNLYEQTFFDFRGVIALSGMTFLDDDATATVSNNYSLELTNNDSNFSLRCEDAGIELLEV